VDFLSSAGQIGVCREGAGISFDEVLAKKVLSEDEITIQVALHDGKASAAAFGCDLTYDYVKINGDYRT
jgi:glutamate N-acetyltransferase/amino-acid N-acetyltransferase